MIIWQNCTISGSTEIQYLHKTDDIFNIKINFILILIDYSLSYQ